jgi:cation:H+ antiporter
MITNVVFLLASLVTILIFCAVFVNAIECLGKSYNLHQGIIGSILAAVGTALPETIIPVIAILFSKGSQGAHEVGIGAIAGAPFMLATLGFFVTGTAVVVYGLMGKREFKMKIDSNIMSKDLLFFMIIYGAAIGTSFFNGIIWLKVTVAILLLLSYAIYLKMVIHSDSEMIEESEPLYISKYLKIEEHRYLIFIQLFIALFFIIAGAHFFIKYVQTLSSAIGVSPLILSLIITPIATELPEKLNSIIWVGRKKDTLALGNITGAMVFQSCFPVAFGMLSTEWRIRGITLVSAVLALSSALLTFSWLKFFKNINPFILMAGGGLYLIFIFCLMAGIRA